MEIHRILGDKVRLYRRAENGPWHCSTYLNSKEWRKSTKERTRREFNAQIIDLNLERAIRSGRPETAAWAQFEKDQAEKDRALEQQLARERRARTEELRNTSRQYTAETRRVRAEHRLKSRRTLKRIQDTFAERREALRARQQEQRQAMRKRHKGFMARIARRLSKNVRARHTAERTQQVEAHREERRFVSEAYQQARAQAKEQITAEATLRDWECDYAAVEGRLIRIIARYYKVREKDISQELDIP